MMSKRATPHDDACCSEHCNDYLQLLQALIDAENTIEELRQQVAMLDDLLDERNS